MTKCIAIRDRIQAPERSRVKEEQIEFNFGSGPKPKIVFDAEHITSDTGLVALRQVDERFGLTAMAAKQIVDGRWQPMVVHPVERLVREAVYGYAAGYEDANDHTPLRNDPVYGKIIGPIHKTSINPKKQEGLASEATLSRLLGRRKLDVGEVFDDTHVDQFVRVMEEAPPRFITLDVDGYDAETYGMQQLTLFNGFYEQQMYYPLHVSVAEYGWICAVRIRPGNASAGEDAVEVLGRIIAKFRAAWPKLRIRVRGDSGFASPKLYEACEAWNVEYVIRMRKNEVLQRLLTRLAKQRQTDEPDAWEDGRAVVYYEGRYKAKGWGKWRRVIFKMTCDMDRYGEDEVYVLVTNLRKAPKKAWTIYAHRGQEEQRIEEFKNDLRGEKLSCSDMADNGMKLQLQAMAHNLFAAVRIGLPENHELKRATVGRLRLVLVKCGAMVKQTARQMWLHASRHFPYRHHVMEVSQMALAPQWRPTPLWGSG